MSKIEERKARMAANGKLMDESWERFQQSRKDFAADDGPPPERPDDDSERKP